ncbi:Rrf2 family transcriptional regulator [Lacticaseibacillus nasuensis]|uniref:Rrf2 family transcriptional regulator n=1 Tax=Lacticaseibacillus nasuensis TaxID=944671 RepID=UPI00224862B9|nr:Rrf2 family transcriptional regulator [Lacticaseibacillus nasuensis]MCX2454957.1 Rrf2 family transcriptional regulator [Lacticaseibacillus nasuensis]
MHYSHKLSDAIHVLAYVQIGAGWDLASKEIAASINANPSVVRRLMAQLVKGGLLTSQPGAVRPALARPAESISLLDIYRVVAGTGPLLHLDEQTSPACPVGGNIQDTLSAVYDSVQAAAEARMAAISLQQIIDDIVARAKARQMLA